ncbi:MAG: fumarylacetoacetate hydrolase family protein [Ignavibacteria bacterium]|nr:fumarylacetoacetate hydrolase family protein [Ignavibacteria bacterium]
MASVRLLPDNRSVPVNTIFCIGRNYAKHAAELGNAVEETPVVFLKPVSALIGEDRAIELPSFSNTIHHEAELVVLLGRGGKDIPREDAPGCVRGYGIGLDLTARDTQDALKAKGLPWTIAKGFDTSACLSAFVPKEALPDPRTLRFTLDVNGERRQTGDTAMMLFPVDVLIAYLSTVFTLSEGDLIFTGTPEGVAPIARGDVLSLHLMDTVSAQFLVR